MGSKMTILVVEDDAESADMLIEMLGMAGYDVETVSTADQALAALRTGSYGAALLDLTLPGISTPDLVERVSGVAGKPPLVIFSARPSEELGAAAQRLSAAAVLQKPGRMESILATMAQVTGVAKG